MSAVYYTLNTATGTYVRGRRSVRLAAKRGEGGSYLPFFPRVERYKATTPSERYPPIAPGTPAGVAQRRTSPRLAPMYAKKAAVEKQKADALRLVDEVLAFANKVAPKEASAPKEAPAPPKGEGFTIFYDAIRDECVTCHCGECEEIYKLGLRAAFFRFSGAVKPLVEAGQSGSSQATTAAMVATFDHPDLGTVLRGARVLPSLARFREMLEKKAREFADHPKATPTLRLVCAEILRKYFS